MMAASWSALLCLATNADEVEEERQRSGLDRRGQCPSVLAEVAKRMRSLALQVDRPTCQSVHQRQHLLTRFTSFCAMGPCLYVWIRGGVEGDLTNVSTAHRASARQRVSVRRRLR